MSTCDIIIPIWNQPVLTQRCLESIAASTATPYRLILIDNGSEAPTRERLEAAARREPGRVQVIRNPENLGFVKAVNQGIRASSAPYVCLLNNDTVATPGWLEEMIRVAESDPMIGLVNPSSNTLGFRPPATTAEGITVYAKRLEARRGEIRELSVATGFCLFIKRTVLERIGLFDERYGMGNFEDADFSLRALAQGFRCVQAVGAYVYHEEKASFKLQPGWEAAFRENQRLFARHWGRPLRIVWEDHRHDGRWPMAELLHLLRRGHWLRYSAVNGAVPSEVRQFVTAEPLAHGSSWRWAVLWHVLKRRKKPVDLVVTHDPMLRRWLGWLKPCHRARLLWQPAPAEVEEACQRLSRSP